MDRVVVELDPRQIQSFALVYQRGRLSSDVGMRIPR